MATYLEDGRPGPAPEARTTQSLAYALLGPGFLYYLTGDPELLDFIVAVKDHIFSRYWSDERQELRWANAATGDDSRDRRELVAQLDQINAYLLLLAPLLPDPDQRDAWRGDLRRLADVILRDDHDPARHRFHGYLHDPRGRQWGERHNDFGHTGKAYWMLERTGRLLGDQAMVDLARAGLADVLSAALVPCHLRGAPPWQRTAMARAAAADSTYWVWSNQPDGLGIAWWEWAELDQAAMTLALDQPRWLAALDLTLPVWFATMVDPATGAVVAFPGAGGGPLAHQWQNGYHAAEHALVGYITAAMVGGESWRLYYAPVNDRHPLRAYFFEAELEHRRLQDGRVEAWFHR
ncbi:MAG: hypothetical protein R3D98_13505 [Candidatus Krumholzibacteriia bacterium]